MTSQPEFTNNTSISRFKSKQKKQLNTDALIKGILNKDRRCLSQAITLVESTNTKHSQKANTILKTCILHTKPSIRIGITGVPGVGKSTFIERLGSYVLQQGKRIAVLAVDPSSSVTKGSILGDKTRMPTLAKHEQVFIRPSASGETLGGVARKTRETITLCEAAGFDVIIIETVGVGQSETAVHSMVDFFLLLKLAGAGDELQGIKRGIIEMADAITITKADGTNVKPAELAKAEFNKALHLYPKKPSGWLPRVTTCSALEQKGIENIWEMITEYSALTTKNNHFLSKRKAQNKFWLVQTIEHHLKSNFFNHSEIKEAFQEQLKRVETNKTTAFAAAEYLLQKFSSKNI